MGSSNSRKKLISIEDLDKSTFSIEHIEKIFENNSNGFISLGEFSRLLDGKIKIEILKKLYSYFCFDKKYLNKDDLKYFYFIFTTNDTNIKINFICDLIFKKNKKKYIKFQEKVFLYFSNDELYKIIINDKLKELYERSTGEISKESFKQFLIKNFKPYFNNFSFVKMNKTIDFKIGLSPDNFELNQNNKKDLNNNYFISSNELSCKCFCLNKKKISIKPETQTKNQYEIFIDGIKEEFLLIERKNDNLFTISNLDKMMTDIDINIIIINIVSSYLKKKTQKVKNFIYFLEFYRFSYFKKPTNKYRTFI